jgi:hypothetical protein
MKRSKIRKNGIGRIPWYAIGAAQHLGLHISQKKRVKRGIGGLNMSDYISLEAMSETPKCPYCGDRMEIHVRTHTTEQEFFSAWYQCVTCESTSPRIEFIGNTSQTKIEERLQAVSSRRVEPKNRVLTLEEVAKSEVMWYDDRLRTRAQVVILGWGRCEPDFTKLVDRCGDEFYRKNASYNDFWRCWLRKPTEAERRETPWAGDSRE